MRVGAGEGRGAMSTDVQMDPPATCGLCDWALMLLCHHYVDTYRVCVPFCTEMACDGVPHGGMIVRIDSPPPRNCPLRRVYELADA